MKEHLPRTTNKHIKPKTGTSGNKASLSSAPGRSPGHSEHPTFPTQVKTEALRIEDWAQTREPGYPLQATFLRTDS